MNRWMDGWRDKSYNAYFIDLIGQHPSWEGTITINIFSSLRNVSLCAFPGTGMQVGPNSLYFHLDEFTSRYLTSACPNRQSLIAPGI